MKELTLWLLAIVTAIAMYLGVTTQTGLYLAAVTSNIFLAGLLPAIISLWTLSTVREEKKKEGDEIIKKLKIFLNNYDEKKLLKNVILFAAVLIATNKIISPSNLTLFIVKSLLQITTVVVLFGVGVYLVLPDKDDQVLYNTMYLPIIYLSTFGLAFFLFFFAARGVGMLKTIIYLLAFSPEITLILLVFSIHKQIFHLTKRFFIFLKN